METAEKRLEKREMDKEDEKQLGDINREMKGRGRE